MKTARLILSIVMLLGFSNHQAGATIINLGDGDFYDEGLTITRPQNLFNNCLSLDWPAFNVSSTLFRTGIRHLPDSDVDLRDTVYKVSFLNNLKRADLDRTGSDGLEQSGREHNNPAPVPEPSTMLLLGVGFVISARYIKKLRGLP